MASWTMDEEGNWREDEDDEEEGDGDSGEGGGGGGSEGGGEDSGGDGGDSGGWEEPSPPMEMDSGDGGGDSGWAGQEDYEQDGRAIRKYTDVDGTEYFEDVGAWQPDGGGGDDRGFDSWSSGDPDLDRDIVELHRFHDPYELTDYEDDPVRQQITRGEAPDGMRFDDLDEPTRGLFRATYGEEAPSRWAEEHTRELNRQLREGHGIRMPAPQPQPSSVPVFRPTPPVSEQEASAALATTRPTISDPRDTGVVPPLPPPAPEAPTPPSAPEPPRPAISDPRDAGVTPPTPPPAPESPPAQPPPAPTPPPASEPAPAQGPAPAPAPDPAGRQVAANAAATAAAQRTTDPNEIAAAAVAATLAYDRRALVSESPETQARFRATYGEGAGAEWARQHNEELRRNYALYGHPEPRAGTAPAASAPQGTPAAPDRTIGRAQPAPWNGESPLAPREPSQAAPAAPPSQSAPPPAPAAAPSPAAGASPPSPPQRRRRPSSRRPRRSATSAATTPHRPPR